MGAGVGGGKEGVAMFGVGATGASVEGVGVEGETGADVEGAGVLEGTGVAVVRRGR